MHRFSLVFFLLLTIARAATAQAPDFAVTDSDGKTHHLYADYIQKGKVVVLEVFFVGCPPCAAHAPHYQTLYQQMKSTYGDRVEFFLLSDKAGDTNPHVAQYRTDRALTMPGAGADGGSVAAVQPYKGGQFGFFFGTPTFVVIAPGTGEVFYDVRGNNAAGTMNLIGQKIAELLPLCRIRTPAGDTLQRYQATLSVPGGSPVATTQVTSGGFSLDDFPGLPPLPFYEITPTKNDDPINGVSTFDLLQINKQILGIEPFQHPWQFTAADANNSGTVTTFDIVELRKLILGVYDTLPARSSWVFSPGKDTISPLECPAITAIKIGDVNGNANAKNLHGNDDRSASTWTVWLDQPPLAAGQTRTVQVRTGKDGSWSGLQAAFRFDPQALRLHAVRASALPGFDDRAWHLTDGRLAISWLSADFAAELAEGTVVLEIELTALQDGPLAAFLFPEDAPLRAEAYSSDGSIHSLLWTSVPAFSHIGMALVPNPARGSFTVYWERAAPGTEWLQLFDGQGRLVFEKRLSLERGQNACAVLPGALPAGTYLVRAGGTVIGRLVWME